MHIIGTAGHVDHGKSSLVIALTGHNPDRFIEERERGMTLDLGFAPLRFEDGVEAGIIDVPGHERFLHNMLAGAAGMEVLLLVIAANEGPRPQTFDHLHILNFLNVRKAIVVLTKRDLVDDAELEIAQELVRDATAGTVATGATMVAVSSVTGAGIAELKAAIHDALSALAPRDAEAPAYLPVDRVFALPGHGTIVTGTLMQGTIRTGDELALQPSGIEVRVRSLQTFGERRVAVSGGARVAVNLPGVETGAIRRGETLVARRVFVPASTVQVDFTALQATAPLLKRRTPVRVYVGSAEIPGTLVFDARVPAGGETAPATLRLARPAVLFPGSRLIVRRMSPKDLLGGAIARSGAAERASQPVENGDRLDNRVLSVIESSGIGPLEPLQVAAAANVMGDAASAALDRLQADGLVIALSRPAAYLARTHIDSAFDRVHDFFQLQFDRKPWLLGASTSSLAKALAVGEALAGRLLHFWLEDGRMAQTGRLWHLPGQSPALTPAQRDWFATALRADPASPLLPYSSKEVEGRASAAGVEGLTEALETLLATGGLVRIGDDLYRRAQVERARALLHATLQGGKSATMSQLRDVFGTSRKYVLPLMEYFDGIGLTMRDGDLRRLRHTTKELQTT